VLKISSQEFCLLSHKHQGENKTELNCVFLSAFYMKEATAKFLILATENLEYFHKRLNLYNVWNNIKTKTVYIYAVSLGFSLNFITLFASVHKLLDISYCEDKYSEEHIKNSHPKGSIPLKIISCKGSWKLTAITNQYINILHTNDKHAMEEGPEILTTPNYSSSLKLPGHKPTIIQ